MSGSYKTVRRFTIVGACITAFVFIDGLVLFITGGLSGDATPVFPMLGGTFSKNRSSGTSLIVLAVILAAVTFAGWWTLGRRLRAAERNGAAGMAAQQQGSHLSPGSAPLTRHDG